MNRIRVMLADDQRLFVESLKSVLETRAEDVSVIGIAKDGAEAVEMAIRLNPDIVLMDLRMPAMDGVEATKRIKERAPGIQVVMLTTFDDDEYVREALLCGAVGYLLKDIPPSEVIASLRAVKEGSVLISAPIAAKLIGRIAELEDAPHHPERAERDPGKLQSLSGREREVLDLLAEGLDNREIADRLFLAEQTVKNLVSMIYSKIGTHNRISAMKIASGEDS